MATQLKMASGGNGDVKSQVSAEEWAIRVDLAAAYRLVALYGWDDMIFTHLSARVPGPEHHFLINPYNLMFEEITASSLVKIDVEGHPVHGNAVPDQPGRLHHPFGDPHGARRCPGGDARAHPGRAGGAAPRPMGLLPITQTAMLIRDEVAYHEYEGVATDLEERERLVEDLGRPSTR